MRMGQFFVSVATAACLLGAVLVTPATADDSGDEWLQYRHEATKNAVIDSGVDEMFTGNLATPNQVRATPA